MDNDVKKIPTTKTLTPEEIAARREAFNKLRDEGHTIELTARGKNSGVSYDYWARLKKDVDAGIFVDVTEPGLAKDDKLGMADGLESVFKEYGYIKNKEDFLKMKASNVKGGKSYHITYDDYVEIARKSGFELVKDQPETPTPEPPAPPTPEPPAPPTPVPTEPPTPVPTEPPTSESEKKQGQDKPDTVILDSIIWTDENNNKIAEKTTGSVNGKPYSLEIGLDTFGTVDPETVDISKLSNKELKKLGSAPNGGKKITTEPDTLPKPAPNDKALAPTEEINVAEPVVVADAPPVAKSTQTVDATPVKNTKTETTKEEFQKALASDPELGNKTDKERAEILKAKASSIETEISRLQQPTVVYKKRLFGGSKSKVIATAEQNTEANKDKIAELKQKLDSTKRIKEYADAVAGNITGFGSTSLVDKDGNTVASYPQYTTVKYRDANGQESNVAKVIEYNTTTHKPETKYYSFDVQKVNDLKELPERWQAVPDMKNQLTDGQEVR